MPIIEFWPIGAHGPGAEPDRFDVLEGEAERIIEILPISGCLIITDRNDEKYGVFLRNYRYIHFCNSTAPDIQLPEELPPTQE